MEELQLTLTPARVDQRNFGVMLSNWRVGQVINAMVVDRMPSGNLLLNVGGREFVTPMDLPVRPGNRLQLEVQQVAPQLVLKVLTGAEKSAAAQFGEPAARASTLGMGSMNSQAIGQTTTVTTLLSSLASQPGLRAAVSQNPAMTTLLSTLTSQALQPTTLSAGALSQAVAQSGLFHEANLLASRSGSIRTSAKTQLIQLQRALTDTISSNVAADTRAALSSVSDLTNAALANLTQQQLISMPQDNGGQRWVFSLPLEWAGSFTELAMTVEREPPEAGLSDGKQRWRINLNIELPEMGRLVAMVSLAGSELSVVFRSDSPEVRGTFERSLADLRERMIVSDFRVKELSTATLEEPSATGSQTSGRFEVTV